MVWRKQCGQPGTEAGEAGAGAVAGWLLPSPLSTPTFTLFKAASCAAPGQCPVSGHLWAAFAALHARRSLGPLLDASMKFSWEITIHKHYTNLFKSVAMQWMLNVSHKSVVNGGIISNLSCHVSSKIIVKLRQRERYLKGRQWQWKVSKRSYYFNFCLELTFNTPANQPTLPTGSLIILKATVGSP